MKVKDYKLEFDAAGVALLSVGTGNGTYIAVCEIDGLDGKGADEVSSRVEFELAQRGIEVSSEEIAPVGEVGVGDAGVVSLSNDMASIRSIMRGALLDLCSDKNIHKKKDMIPVYDTLCKVSQVMINAAKVEYVANLNNSPSKK